MYKNVNSISKETLIVSNGKNKALYAVLAVVRSTAIIWTPYCAAGAEKCQLLIAITYKNDKARWQILTFRPIRFPCRARSTFSTDEQIQYGKSFFNENMGNRPPFLFPTEVDLLKQILFRDIQTHWAGCMTDIEKHGHWGHRTNKMFPSTKLSTYSSDKNAWRQCERVRPSLPH